MEKTNKNIKAFKSLFSLIIRIRPLLFGLLFISGLMQTASVLLNVYIPKLAIDLLVNRTFESFINFIIAISLGKFALHYLGDILTLRADQEMTITVSKLNSEISKKAMSMKYHFLEDPSILELKQASESLLDYGTFFRILTSLGEMLASLFSVVGIVVILINFSKVLFIIITLLTLIGYAVDGYINLETRKFMQRLIPINRRYNYYANSLFRSENQKDFRLYGVGDMIIEKNNMYNLEIANEIYNVKEIMAKGEILTTAFEVLSTFCLYSYAGLRVLGIYGDFISIGNFTVLINSSEAYKKSLRQFGTSMSFTLTMLPLLEPLIDYLSLEEMDQGQDLLAGKPGDFQSLVFENVSFTYPKTDRKILDNLSFQLKKGEILSIVGRNNSGKSTIVKLICRLFEPDEGRILWNGVDIREYSYGEYLKELATVFQDFKLFPIRIWENIATDYVNMDIESGGDLPGDLEEKINEIIRKVELDDLVSTLPQGIYSWMDKNLNVDGVQFSGGQNQKMAIGRAIFQDSSLAILDEPTAALDPLAEAKTYETLADLVENKTAIFISHRMSASKFSDRILILEDGKISGNGSHEELLKTNTLYKSLFENQAQYYKD